MSQWMEPNESNAIGEGTWDVSNNTTFKFALNERGRSLIVDFSADNNGNNQGSVAVCAEDAVGSPGLFTIKAGQMRAMPLPSAKWVTMIVAPGSQGLFHIYMTKDIQVGVWST